MILGYTYMLIMVLIFGTLILCFGLAYSQQCNSTEGLHCCLGYYWNDALKKCTACKDGFHGMNCSQPCPETFYGPGCRSKCLCNTRIDYCHHVFGCMPSSSQVHSCNWNRNHGVGSIMLTSVISMIVISGVFLVLYIALHFFMTKCQSEHLLPTASTTI